jgi:hypothetical protein
MENAIINSVQNNLTKLQEKCIIEKDDSSNFIQDIQNTIHNTSDEYK